VRIFRRVRLDHVHRAVEMGGHGALRRIGVAALQGVDDDQVLRIAARLAVLRPQQVLACAVELRARRIDDRLNAAIPELAQQEIVERIRSRGAVHRKFTGFLADADRLIAAGTKVVAGEKEVGEVTSVASVRVPNGKKTVALGYVRREALAAGPAITLDGIEATAVDLPFEI